MEKNQMRKPMAREEARELADERPGHRGGVRQEARTATHHLSQDIRLCSHARTVFHRQGVKKKENSQKVVLKPLLHELRKACRLIFSQMKLLLLYTMSSPSTVAASHQTRSYTIDEFGIRDGYAQLQTVLPRRRVEVAGAGGPCVRVEERHGGRECIHVHVRRRSTVSAKMPVGVSARSSGWREVEVAKAARHEPTLAVEGGAGGGRRVRVKKKKHDIAQ
ncbi:hypothetical protein C8F01DRAFT_1285976 [Mycena amicta]|nr:hypothetical protein C8F01DRAFT_1285976 [Mycena amicta]